MAQVARPTARVCHVTSVHPPFDPRIFRKELRTLAAAGYTVSLIAPHKGNVVVDGIAIKGLPPAKSRLERFFKSTWLVYTAARRHRAEIYHIHDPELLGVGLVLKALGHQVIYDAHEDLAASILGKAYIPRFLRRLTSVLAGSVEAFTATFLDRVVAATPVIARRFPDKKTVIVRNFPVIAQIRDECEKPYSERLPLIVYIGSITQIRGVREIVNAVALLPAELNARLALAGEFYPATLADWVRDNSATDQVQILGWLDGRSVARLLGDARVGLVTLHPTAAYVNAEPTKLFEYMAAGIPVVASNFPLWEDLIKSSGCGLTVDPTKAESIADALFYLLSNPDRAQEMGRRGQVVALERFSWATEGAKLLSMYAALRPSDE